MTERDNSLQGYAECDFFRTRCWIGERLCSMIIEPDCCANLVSTYVISKLSIPTIPHPHPYKLQWLNVGEMRVTQQALISFNLGKLDGVVLCDVVPMHVSHILLGRPWQFERRVTYDRYANSYTLRHKGKNFKLLALSPEEAHKDKVRFAKNFEGHVMEENTRLKLETEKAKELVEQKNDGVVNIREEEMKNEESESVVEVNEPEFVDERVEMSEESIVKNECKELILVEAKEDGVLQNSCSSLVASSLQVHDDQPYEADTGLLDASNTARISSLIYLDPDHIDGKPEHIFFDPFCAYVVVCPTLHCYHSVAITLSFNVIYIKPRDCSFVPLVKLGSSCQRSIGLQSSINFVFDPGISLRIVVVCSRLVCVDHFYDILLIRGRILSNREGMM